MTNNSHHSVYIIELNRDVCKESSFIAENPDFNRSLPCYYVGITGLEPEKRFLNHKEGYKSSRIVKKYGRRLVPELYESFNPMTYEQAKSMEITLARLLRFVGHGVWQK